jgi:hypothetical protein
MAGASAASAQSLTPSEAKAITEDAYIYGYSLITTEVTRVQMRNVPKVQVFERDRGFADSPLEGDGFEPSVPCREGAGLYCGSELRGDRRAAKKIWRGTDGSNPSPSSGESDANFASSDKAERDLGQSDRTACCPLLRNAVCFSTDAGPHYKLPQDIELFCRFALERGSDRRRLGLHPSRLRGLVRLMLARDSA